MWFGQDTKFCHVGRGAASDSMQSPLSNSNALV
jgi:hypothetical protein